MIRQDSIDHLVYCSYRAQRENGVDVGLLSRHFPNADYYENMYQQELSGDLVFLGSSCSVPGIAILEA